MYVFEKLTGGFAEDEVVAESVLDAELETGLHIALHGLVTLNCDFNNTFQGFLESREKRRET